MRHTTDARTIAQAAAFALFEGLRAAQGRVLAPIAQARVTSKGEVDPTSCGLAGVRKGDAALELAVSPAPGAMAKPLWVHASTDERGPRLTAYLRRDRAALATRFAGSSWQMVAKDRFVLRERPLFPSHDRRHTSREAAVRRLAEAWDVPLDGPWLVVGEWDALEGRWDLEAVRRFAAIAWLLDAARGDG
jgi:hypothetical protein